MGFSATFCSARVSVEVGGFLIAGMFNLIHSGNSLHTRFPGPIKPLTFLPSSPLNRAILCPSQWHYSLYIYITKYMRTHHRHVFFQLQLFVHWHLWPRFRPVGVGIVLCNGATTCVRHNVRSVLRWSSSHTGELMSHERAGDLGKGSVS